MISHQKSQARQVSFLDLPVELRLVVYKYLVPNTVVPVRYFPSSDDAHSDHLNLRTDGRFCYPAILRTNRLIYEEAIDLWYGTAVFYLNILGDFLNFQGTKYFPGDVLPQTLRRVRTLHITLTLRPPSDRYAPWVQVITDSLAAGPYNLRHVTISHVSH
jgi:hypothetical protein